VKAKVGLVRKKLKETRELLYARWGEEAGRRRKRKRKQAIGLGKNGIKIDLLF
jgi:hypothetical protein